MPIAYCSRVASETQQLCGGHCGTDAGGDAGLRPCDGSLRRRRRDRLGQSAHQFHAECERQQEIRAVRRTPLGQRERGRCNRSRRVHHCFGMRIVVRIDAGAETVDQAGVQRIGLAAAADHRGVWCAGIFAERVVGDLHHLVPRATDRATKDVEERTERFPPHALGQVGPACRQDVVGQSRRDVACRAGECNRHGCSPSERACRAAVTIDHAVLDAAEIQTHFASCPLSSRQAPAAVFAPFVDDASNQVGEQTVPA
jgi:hypothetical protein